MEDILVWPVVLYGGWLAVVGMAISAALIVAAVQTAHRDIARATAADEHGKPNRLLEVLACWLLYFIPSFVIFFVLFAANTDLASALLSASVTGTVSSTMFTVKRLINTRLKPFARELAVRSSAAS